MHTQKPAQKSEPIYRIDEQEVDIEEVLDSVQFSDGTVQDLFAVHEVKAGIRDRALLSDGRDLRRYGSEVSDPYELSPHEFPAALDLTAHREDLLDDLARKSIMCSDSKSGSIEYLLALADDLEEKELGYALFILGTIVARFENQSPFASFLSELGERN